MLALDQRWGLPHPNNNCYPSTYSSQTTQPLHQLQCSPFDAAFYNSSNFHSSAPNTHFQSQPVDVHRAVSPLQNLSSPPPINHNTRNIPTLYTNDCPPTPHTYIQSQAANSYPPFPPPQNLPPHSRAGYASQSQINTPQQYRAHTPAVPSRLNPATSALGSRARSASPTTASSKRKRRDSDDVTGKLRKKMKADVYAGLRYSVSPGPSQPTQMRPCPGAPVQPVQVAQHPFAFQCTPGSQSFQRMANAMHPDFQSNQAATPSRRSPQAAPLIAASLRGRNPRAASPSHQTSVLQLPTPIPSPSPSRAASPAPSVHILPNFISSPPPSVSRSYSSPPAMASTFVTSNPYPVKGSAAAQVSSPQPQKPALRPQRLSQEHPASPRAAHGTTQALPLYKARQAISQIKNLSAAQAHNRASFKRMMLQLQTDPGNFIIEFLDSPIAQSMPNVVSQIVKMIDGIFPTLLTAEELEYNERFDKLPPPSHDDIVLEKEGPDFADWPESLLQPFNMSF